MGHISNSWFRNRTIIKTTAKENVFLFFLPLLCVFAISQILDELDIWYDWLGLACFGALVLFWLVLFVVKIVKQKRVYWDILVAIVLTLGLSLKDFVFNI